MGWTKYSVISSSPHFNEIHFFLTVDLNSRMAPTSIVFERLRCRPRARTFLDDVISRVVSTTSWSDAVPSSILRCIPWSLFDAMWFIILNVNKLFDDLVGERHDEFCCGADCCRFSLLPLFVLLLLLLFTLTPLLLLLLLFVACWWWKFLRLFPRSFGDELTVNDRFKLLVILFGKLIICVEKRPFFLIFLLWLFVYLLLFVIVLFTKVWYIFSSFFFCSVTLI